MKRSLSVAVSALLVLASVTMGLAQETKGFRADLIGHLSYVEKQILDLENAIPESKLTWRPDKDTRSVIEVYSHIAFANYLIAKFAGIQLPEGIVINSPEDGIKWQTMSADKKVVANQIVKSFDFLRSSIGAMSDASLENTVEFFGQKMTTRSLLMVLLSHVHEHLGQSIAYARMQGVVPPWTAAQMAAEKAKK
jgi:uncharacterized damage-inducible protein DinB